MSRAVKSAIVTGAASGLGRAIAVELARHGYRIALADIDNAGSHETLQLVRAAGGDGRVEHLDVASSESWLSLRDRLQLKWADLDLLVNNAGFGAAGDLDQWTIADWQRILGVNLNGAVYGCHALADWLKLNPAGSHIVNIASLAAIASAPGMAPYNAAKAAVLSFSETLYGELKPYGIGVSCVCPAFFHTNIVENSHYAGDEHRVLMERLMGMSRVTPEQVARKVWRGIERKRLYVFVPAVAEIIWRLKRLAPLWLLKIVANDRAKHAQAVARELAARKVETKPEILTP